MFKQVLGPKRFGCEYVGTKRSRGNFYVNGDEHAIQPIAVFKMLPKPSTSKYKPHQGAKECARRSRQP